jgi:hypothetical protein
MTHVSMSTQKLMQTKAVFPPGTLLKLLTDSLVQSPWGKAHLVAKIMGPAITAYYCKL